MNETAEKCSQARYARTILKVAMYLCASLVGIHFFVFLCRVTSKPRVPVKNTSGT